MDDGSHAILFPDNPQPQVGLVHDMPCGLVSLTNLSIGHEDANANSCAMIHCNESEVHLNGIGVPHTAWLVATRDIEVGRSHFGSVIMFE